MATTMNHQPEQNAISKSRPQPASVDELLHSVRQTLGNLSRWGCSGFSCSHQTLMKLDNWTASGVTDTQKETLNHIHAELGACNRCSLSSHRRNILFGQGSPSADLVFVGQMPSKEEDQKGSYYHGLAGQLLLKMVRAMKMTPEQVYVCNVVKCAGSAKPIDIKTCMPFLKRQLKAIDPKVICTLGEGPSQILLGQSDPIASLRGRFFNYAHGKIMPTLDPAFLVDHPEEKRKVWEDLKKIMAYLGIAL
jgi:DNA polymerase